ARAHRTRDAGLRRAGACRSASGGGPVLCGTQARRARPRARRAAAAPGARRARWRPQSRRGGGARHSHPCDPRFASHHRASGRASHGPGDEPLRPGRGAQFRPCDRRRRPRRGSQASRRHRSLSGKEALMAPILELRAVKAFYGQSEVLHGIDVAVEDGGMSVLLGANGAGKTTTLRAISGMVRSEGEIHFAGQRLERRSTEAIAGLGVAHVPEGRGTMTGLTVEENLRLGAYTRPGRPDAAMARMYDYFP